MRKIGPSHRNDVLRPSDQPTHSFPAASLWQAERAVDLWEGRLNIKRRAFIMLLGGAAVWPLAAKAQQPERVRRIGVLMGYPEGDPQAQANVTALRQGLREVGWTEGRNVQIDYRWAGGDPDKARTFAKELIGMTPDVIVPSTNQVTRIVQQETRTIPVVFAFVGDPVGSGFATSL